MNPHSQVSQLITHIDNGLLAYAVLARGTLFVAGLAFSGYGQYHGFAAGA